MYYKDYRESIRKIVDNVDDNQSSLNLGAIAILAVLGMAMQDSSETSDLDSTESVNDSEDKSDDSEDKSDDSEDKSDDSEDKSDDSEDKSDDSEDKSDDSEDKSDDSEDAKKPLSVEEHYSVAPGNQAVIAIRTLKGAKLLNANNNQPLSAINESAVRDNNITNGSLLEVHYDTKGDCQIIRILDDVDLPVDDIETFNFGVVKCTNGHHYVNSSATGDKLPHVFNIPDNVSWIKEGDVVDLAWYKDNPKDIQIRWTYPVQNLPEKKSESKPKPAIKKSETETPRQPLACLDYNLKGRLVTVVIGDNVKSAVIKKLIADHQGRSKILNAFKVSTNKYWKKELRHDDIVVMVQSLNSHSTSKVMQKYIKHYNLHFAIADTAGTSSIERAIYRAFKDLPAYETPTQPIEYPVV